MLTTQDTQKDNSFAEARKQTEEYKRLQEVREQNIPWKKWGPYLSDRQWATMREYYGEEDKAWGYFSHDEARNRAYRWGEDGIFGISDDQQRLCFALSLWNGQDEYKGEKHIKERFFGLPGMWGQNQGNHMEDVKEYYFYLDNTPTHSYMKALYKYPYKFPYDDLIEENNKRGKDKPEYELIDTNCFDDGYFDVVVEYAKKNPEDILIKITIWNQGNDEHDLHILPTLWFRNTWSWGQLNDKKPSLKIINNPQFKNELADVKNNEFVLVEADCHNPTFKPMYFYCEKPQEVLFTDNETGKKNAIEKYVFNQDAEQSRQQGTKLSADYFESILPHESTKKNRKVIRLRLSNDPNKVAPFANDFEEIFGQRQKEADAFYEAITPFRISDSDEELQIQRQAFAGMLWNKQFYYYVVQDWLQGDFLYHRHRIYPDHEMPKPDKRNINSQWTHLHNENIISMPDKWEYPYYCVWDSAFHAVTFALIDPDFAKEQLSVDGKVFVQ